MNCTQCDCKLPMRYIKEVNNDIILTFEGKKEYSFIGFHRCRKCRFIIRDNESNEVLNGK